MNNTTLRYPLFYFWKLRQNNSGHKYWNSALKVISGRHGALVLQQTLSIQRTTKWARLTSIKMRPCEHEWPRDKMYLRWPRVPQSLQEKQTKVLGLTTSSPNRPRCSIEQESLDETYLGKVAMEKKKRVVTNGMTILPKAQSRERVS